MEGVDVRALTAAQHKVYECLVQLWKRKGAQPSLHDVARSLSIDYVTLRQHLKALDTKGYLRFESQGNGKPPLLKFQRQESSNVPVLGSIAAGPLSDAFAHPEGYLQLTGLSEGYFGLYVRGDSMADFLQDGDVVLLKQGKPQRSGEICAVRIEGSETTLKYVDWRGTRAKTLNLRPHNPAYASVTVNAKDVEIDGVYRGCFRGEPIRLLVQEVDSMA